MEFDRREPAIFCIFLARSDNLVRVILMCKYGDAKDSFAALKHSLFLSCGHSAALYNFDGFSKETAWVIESVPL